MKTIKEMGHLFFALVLMASSMTTEGKEIFLVKTIPNFEGQ